MALALQKNAQEQETSSKGRIFDMKEEEKFKEEEEEEEEEEELFEINLDIVDNLPPPYYWESYVTATTSTLFANCLVPRADVSSAVPLALDDGKNSSASGKFIWVAAEPLQNFVGLSSLGSLSDLLQKKTASLD